MENKSVAEKYQYGMWYLAKKSKRRFFFAQNSDDFKICSKYQGDNWHSFRVLSIEAISGLIPGLCPANERYHHKVTPSLIGWAQTKNQPWICISTDKCISVWNQLGHVTFSISIRTTKLVFHHPLPLTWRPGGHLNIKMASYQYRDSPC